MMKSSLLLSSAALSFTAMATEGHPAGARYDAQGGVLVSAARDTFAISVNPANLVLHSEDDWFGEAAVNLNHRDSNSRAESNTLNMAGGFVSKNNIVFGGAYTSTARLNPVPGTDSTALLTPSLSQYVLAAAIGNERSDTDMFTYGIGGVLHLLEADFNDQKTAQTGAGFTVSGQVGAEHTFAFTQQALHFSVDLGAAYTSEIESSDKSSRADTLLQPGRQRYGVTAHVTHLNASLTWDLALTAERTVTDQNSKTGLSVLPSYSQTRAGAELTLIQPFGLKGDFALRAGSRHYDDDAQSALTSAGFGWSSGSWSFDLSVADDALSPALSVYNASVTYRY